jgi:ribosomal protein S18 acetylase RimI-like enzyme
LSIHLEKSKGLTTVQFKAIRQLEAVCNKADGLTMKLNLNTLQTRPADEINDILVYADSHLIGYLALYTFKGDEAEVSAMTHPDYRRRGIFRQMLVAAAQELQKRDIPDFLFICERASATVTPVMQAIEAAYDFSEYKMVLSQTAQPAPVTTALALRRATKADIELLVQMDVICFDTQPETTRKYIERNFGSPQRQSWLAMLNGQIIGKIHVNNSGPETYLNAFCILPDYRGQGYGKAILSQTVARLLTERHKLITLEVETENENALSLYKNVGFEVTTVYDYYRRAVSQVPQELKS